MGDVALLSTAWAKIESQYLDLARSNAHSYGRGLATFEFSSQDMKNCKYHYYYEGTEEYDRMFILCGWKPEEFDFLNQTLVCVRVDSTGSIRRV
jgi:hypothetical protein